MTTKELDFTNPLHAAKAVVTLYHYQTTDEKIIGNTVYENGVGFNGVDASFGTSVAEQLLKDRPITRKQLDVLQRMLPKYKNQLTGAEWWLTELPERVTGILENYGAGPKKKDKPTGDGLLTLDEEGRLEFVPNVYPTTQLKQYGWRRGNRKNWTWVTYLDLGAVNTVQRLWPNLTIDPELQTLIDQLLEAAKLPDQIDKHPILFPFQKEAIQFLHTNPKSMLALAPGLGKTACSIFAADVAPESNLILVVAPLTLVWNWQSEIQKWLNESSVQWHGGKVGKWPEPERWVVTNYATVTRNLDAILDEAWDIIIIDESILVKNRKAQRTAAIKELAKHCDRVWMLSGSPTSRYYDDMWAQLNILHPKRFRSYWRFAERYCYVEKDWGWKIVANKPGAAQALQEDLLDIYFCRTQDQVLDLPPWLFEDYEVPLYGDQWRKYDDMARTFWADLGEGDFVLSPNVLSQITRLIQIASNPAIIGGKGRAAKWDAAISMLEWVEKPVIIWTNFIQTANSIAKMLEAKGYRAAILTGETKQENRGKIVDDFQAGGKIDAIVAHPKVGKFGLTLTAARTAIYLERNYEGDNYYQSLHRVRRIGTTQSPLIIHLLATSPTGDMETIDHTIHRILQYRKDSSIALTSDALRKAAKEQSNVRNNR